MTQASGTAVLSNAIAEEDLTVSLAAPGIPINGTNGPDSLTGTTGDDTIKGFGGNDILKGDAGDDKLFGGPGNDKLFGDDGGDALFGGGGRDRLVSGSNTSAFDPVNNTYLFSEDTTLYGGGGGDTLIATDGSVLMIGGAGNDLIKAIDDGSYFDFTRVSYRLSSSGISAVANGAGGLTIQDGLGGTDTVVGVHVLYDSSHDDTISVDTTYQTSFGNFLEVRLSAGNDHVTFIGFGGRVGFQGSGGGVRADLNTGLATDLHAGDHFIGNDTIAGTVKVLRGSHYSDQLLGSSGDDRLRGEGGNDTINGRAGFDRIEFSGSTSGVKVDLAHHVVSDDGLGGQDTVTHIEGVSGSEFNDVIKGNGGNNLLSGGLGNDKLVGGGGADTISGDDGIDPDAAAAGWTSNDTLIGGAGNDEITGGGGNDRQTGGGGNDKFVFADGFGHDTITDFSGANQEKIDLSDVTAITGFSDLVHHHLSPDSATGFALIDDGAGDTILLKNIHVGDFGSGHPITGADFIF